MVQKMAIASLIPIFYGLNKTQTRVRLLGVSRQKSHELEPNQVTLKSL